MKMPMEILVSLQLTDISNVLPGTWPVPELKLYDCT